MSNESTNNKQDGRRLPLRLLLDAIGFEVQDSNARYLGKTLLIESRRYPGRRAG